MKHVFAKLALLGLFTTAATGTAFAQSEGSPAASNVVLVHGAWVDEKSWDKVAALLRRKGYKVTEVANPLTSLEDDVAATRKALEAQNGPTVLVGHSWGGAVITESGNDPKVKSLVYVAAFAPDQGESIVDLGQGAPLTDGQKAVRPDARGFLTIDPASFPAVFAGDVPAAQAKVLATRQLPINGAAFATKLTSAAWHDKPSFYAISANDKMLAPQAEAFFAQRMKAQTVTLQSSHASPVSHPAEVVALIERAAKAE